MLRVAVLFAWWACACGSSPQSVERTSEQATHDGKPVSEPARLETKTFAEAGAERTTITGQGVALESLQLVEWIGLPMSGRGDIAIHVTVPIVRGQRDFRGARGTIALSCPSGCRLGDDHTKLQVGIRMPTELYFGHIDFETVAIKANLADGRAELTQWSVVSKDLVIKLEASLELASILEESRVTGCVRFAPTAALKAREPRLEALFATTGAIRGSDDLFHIQIDGTLASRKYLAQDCDASLLHAETEPPSGPGAETATEQHRRTSAADFEKLLDKSVKRIANNTYEIKLALFDAVLADPMVLARGCRVVPAVKDGKATALKLMAIRPTSVYAKLGLASGDVVVAINGQPLGDAAQMLEIYIALRQEVTAGQPLVVSIDRNGAPLTFTYKLRR
ncbi:MAG: hypothetical protein AB7O24_28725 [Kofleriaceae bacterium]